jgi:hypothetical protein
MERCKTVEAILNEAAIDSIGVYPTSSDGAPRSDWQEGWNACLSAILKRQSAAQQWFSSFPKWKQEIVEEMLADSVISLEFVPDVEPAILMSFSTSDLFAWGVADAQSIKDDKDLPEFYRAWKVSGLSGMQILVCLREKEKPQWPVEKTWRKEGIWTPELEALPDNKYDLAVRWKKESRLEHIAAVSE